MPGTVGRASTIEDADRDVCREGLDGTCPPALSATAGGRPDRAPFSPAQDRDRRPCTGSSAGPGLAVLDAAEPPDARREVVMSEHDSSLPEGPAAPHQEGERRATPRYPCGRHGSARLIIRHGQAAHWARPCDVSVGGIGLFLAHPVAPGETLTIQPRARPERPVSPLTAAVVHARSSADGSWLVGCAFEQRLTGEQLDQFL
jgi:hypothetical protein